MEPIDYKKKFEELEDAYQGFMDTQDMQLKEAAARLLAVQFQWDGPKAEQKEAELKALYRYAQCEEAYRTYKHALSSFKKILGKPHWWLTEYCGCESCRAVKYPQGVGGLYGPGRY